MSKFKLILMSMVLLGSVFIGTFFFPKNQISDSPKILNDNLEKVVILETLNFSYSESINFPVINISETFLVEIYSANINSTRISQVALREYLPEGTFLLLEFKNNSYHNYSVIKNV